MRREPITGVAAAVSGSHKPLMQFNLFYKGQLLKAELPVTDGSYTENDDADLIRSASLTISDPDGSLMPLLQKNGQRIEVRGGVEISGTQFYVRLGFVRITDIKRHVREYLDAAGKPQRTIEHTVECQDLMWIVQQARLIGGDPPAGLCMDEIRRLLAGVVPSIPPGPFSGISDGAVPSSLRYSDSRLAGMQTLAESRDAKCVITDDGALDVVPQAGSAAVQLVLRTALAPGLDTGDFGQVVDITYRDTAEGVSNAVVARGEAQSDRAPVQAIATDDKSDMAWNTEFTNTPAFQTSPLYTDYASAYAGARTRLNHLIAGRGNEVTIETLPNPLVAVGDTVQVLSAFTSFTGRVKKIVRPAVMPGTMSVTLRSYVTSVTTG